MPAGVCARCFILPSVSAEVDKSDDAGPERARKTVDDLGDLVCDLRRAVLPNKTWQRQLLAQLTNVDRRVQVLRMTIAMGRPPAEKAEATEQLQIALRVTQRHVEGGRADQITRAAILLACQLGSQIDAALL
jgi:hypothetical protein